MAGVRSRNCNRTAAATPRTAPRPLRAPTPIKPPAEAVPGAGPMAARTRRVQQKHRRLRGLRFRGRHGRTGYCSRSPVSRRPAIGFFSTPDSTNTIQLMGVGTEDRLKANLKPLLKTLEKRTRSTCSGPWPKVSRGYEKIVIWLLSRSPRRGAGGSDASRFCRHESAVRAHRSRNS